MPKKKYIVSLSESERQQLETLTTKGKGPAYKLNHARILLKADTHQSGGGWTDQAISEALDISVATIERVRQRLVEQGLEVAIGRKKARQTKPRSLDGTQEARLVALACGDPPTGNAKWSMRLLATRMVELKVVDKLSHETVRQTLKKRAEALVEQELGNPAPHKC